jgi:hypothetical protein
MIIEIQRVNHDNLSGLLATLQGCWKSSSLLWMQLNGFPVLTGLILSGWAHETETAVSRFCRERNFSELLVRIEKPGQRWTRRRGGYTTAVSGVHGLVDELTKEGMLTLLLEPASPYSDLYGLTSVSDLVTGKVDVEVVGRGFDASDVLRGDIIPHERFEISLSDFRQSCAVHITRTYLVGSDDYRVSVQRRLAKIGARLLNPSFPEEELRAKGSHSHSERLKQEAIQYLRRSGQTLLLDHLNEYEPVPPTFLDAFVAQLLRLLRATAEAHVPWKALSVASSFLAAGRLVIWDFFSPGIQNTRELSTIRAAPFSPISSHQKLSQ